MGKKKKKKNFIKHREPTRGFLPLLSHKVLKKINLILDKTIQRNVRERNSKE